MRPQLSFRNGHRDTFVGPDTLLQFATDIGLESVASDRFSLLLPFQIMLYAEVFGIDPQDVVREIRALEGVGESCTKPGSPFRVGGPLEGLHHKHFTTSSISMVASNMLAANGREVLRKLVAEKFADGFSAQAIASFSHAVSVESYERRAESSTLTGEWIVYVEHQGRKYYLCLATHVGGNHEILGYIRNVACVEFTFLRSEFPHLFDGA